MKRLHQFALLGSIFTALFLYGGMLAGIVIGNFVTDLFPHTGTGEPPLMVILAGVLPPITGLLVGSGGWGVLMGRLVNEDDRWRLARAGILGFVPITVVLSVLLFGVEQVVTATSGLPIHQVFTISFVPAAFLIAGVTAWTFGRKLRDRRLARELFWKVGLTAGLAFLIVNVAMEARGWVIGAPGARARDTMITVTMVANLAVALVGGGVMGVVLERRY